MSADRPFRLAIVAGEESGDLLGADLVDALSRLSGRPVELLGVGGQHLAAKGLVPLFDGSEIALMGLSAVVRDLPRLVRRIGQTADAVARFRPDCLVTIDSPEFSLRVARKVRALAPDVPIVHYVCPSVWAWRPARARAMAPHVDRILCLLPFEPAELRRLGGPQGTFVGHRLTADPVLERVREQRQARPVSGQKTLLVLPGSRKSEVRQLLEPFGETVAVLKERRNDFRILLPTLPNVSELVREGTRNWAVTPEILEGEHAKEAAFTSASAALSCSGTVTLELALAGVPAISCYRFDWLARRFMSLITVWSAALPNLITDWPVVPEYINEFVRPPHMARALEQLWDDTPSRAAQLSGFAQLRELLSVERPSGELAAAAVLETAGSRDRA